jgi:hypothetical protein
MSIQEGKKHKDSAMKKIQYFSSADKSSGHILFQ